MNKEKREAIDERIHLLASRNDGRITATEVLQDALDPDSPLHPYFTWDNDEAAERFRLMQARQLIRSVKYISRVDHRKITCVGYVRDPTADRLEQGYVSVEKIRHDEDITRDVLLQEFSRAAAALNRARKLATLFGLTDDIDDFLRELELTRARIQETPAQLNS